MTLAKFYYTKRHTIQYKSIMIALYIVLTCSGLNAQTAAWQPTPEYTQVPIWPGTPPDSKPVAGSEITTLNAKKLVAGKPWIAAEQVSQPTMTVYPAKGNNTGVAVVVFPGGGYRVLAMDLEGTEICDCLTSKGITCILLKYRVPYSGPYWDEKLKRHVTPKVPTALQDAQRTLGLVRFHADEWHINPNKIGVLGFSAGGHLAAAISTHFKKRLYPVVDSADKVSCRPDFAVPIYPGHLWTEEKKMELNPDIAKNITRQTPPTFLLQAEDDYVDNVNQALVYYIGLKNARVPVEMHLYAQGGHAFGLRPSKFPITEWPLLVEKWLRTIGMIAE